MNNRRIALVLAALLTAGASPAMADCCSDVFSCAAAVVTDGLSCEVEAIVNTVKDLITGVKNIINETDGATQNAENSARQSVTDTINTMQSQSQQSASDLAAAQSQSQLIYSEEKNYKVFEKTAVINNAAVLRADGQPASPSAPMTMTARVNDNQLMTNTANSGGKQPAAQRQQERAVSGNSNATPVGNSLHSDQLATSARAPADALITRPAPGTYDDIMLRASKQITALKTAGDIDAGRMTQFMAAAKQSEGPGVQTAEQLAANLINAPLNALSSWLNSMLSNPMAIFDPSAAVDDAENKILNNLDSNLQAMIDAITAGPQQNFNASMGTYNELLGNAESAQAIAAAMEGLYKQRTTAALDALAGLLPQVNYAGLNGKASVSMTANHFGQRMQFSQVAAQFKMNKQKSLLAMAPKLQQFKASLAKLKMQRSQGRPMQSAVARQNNQNSLTQILNGRFAGKSAAGVAAERDQLVAQARTRFAKDPKTESAVIDLLNNEAAKRSSGALGAVPAQGSPKPGQSTVLSQVMQPQTQGKALVPSNAVSNAQAPTKPPVAWGTANGWKPPTATGVQATTPGAPNFKVVPGVRTTQPVPSSVPAPTAPNSAPSSLNP